MIDGAGRGIGRAIALASAEEGAKLALTARTRAELEETASQAAELGAVAWVFPTDVTQETQVRTLVDETLNRFSTIDILVTRDSPDQTTFPGYSSRGDTAKYNPAFQKRQMRSDAA